MLYGNIPMTPTGRILNIVS